MSEIAKLFVSIGANVKDFERGMKGVQGKMRSVGQSMSTVGKTLTKSVTLPLLAIGGAAFAAANEMDKAMNNIRAGTGATGAELQALNEDFKAVFTTVPQGADVVSTALADLNTRTGLTGEALQDLTRQMLNLARVSGDDVNALVASTTRLFGDWEVATASQAETLDYLWKVAQNTGIGVDELSRKMVQYGAPLRQMGFEMEQAAAIMGKFEQEGVNLELVMGSLRIALGNFAREGEEAPAAFRRLVEDIQSMESASEATALAMEIFGARAGPDMAAAIREGRFEIEELLRAIEASDETINAAAEETMNFTESMAVLKNEAIVAMEPLGRVLLDLFREMQPYISQAIALLARLTEMFASLSPAGQKTALMWAGIAIALGPVISFLAKVVTIASSLIPIVTKVGAIVAKAIPVIKAVGVVIAGVATGPLILIVAAIIAAIAIWVKWGAEIRAFARQAVARIREFVSSGIGQISRLVERVRGIMSGVTDAILSPFRRAQEGLQGITSGIQNTLNKINPFARFSPSLVENVQRGVGEIMQAYRRLDNVDLSPITHQVEGATINHTGEITIRGVNDEGQFVAASKVVMQDLSRYISDGNRRFAARTSLSPLSR